MVEIKARQSVAHERTTSYHILHNNNNFKFFFHFQPHYRKLFSVIVEIVRHNKRKMHKN